MGNNFEHSEIMIGYAKLMNAQSNITKVAWDWGDITNALAVDIGATAAGGALGLGKIPLLGVLFGGAKAGAGTAGAMSALGLTATTPVGWAVAIGVLTAGAAWGIYDATRLADNNIKDLLERLDDLDYEGTDAETAITEIRTKLESFKDFFKVQVAPDVKNLQASAQQAQQQLANLVAVSEYLEQVSVTWPQLKPHLKDWGRDPIQFQNALKLTSESIKKQINTLKGQIKQQAAKMVAQKSKEIGIDYKQVAKDIVALHDEIKGLYAGKEMVYETPAEIGAKNLAFKMIDEDPTPEEIDMHGNYMVALRDVLKQQLEKLKQPPAKQKGADSKPPISKRALKMPDGTPVGEIGAGKTPAKSAPRQVKNDVVVKLQQYINHLNIAWETGMSRIAEDGIYGPKTIAAFDKLLTVSSDLAKVLRKIAGMDRKTIADTSTMADSKYLNSAVKILNYFVRQETGEKEEQPSQPQPQQQTAQQTDLTGIVCDPYKENPSREEILACLHNRIMRHPNTRQEQSMYKFLQSQGLTDEAMFAFVYNKWKASRPADWSWPEMVDEFKRGPNSVLR